MFLFLGSASIANAASDEQDIAKIKCSDFLKNTNEIEFMLAWIDGYLSAKSDNTVISQAWMEKLGTHLGKYCAQNGNKTIMDAINAVPAD